MEDVLVVQLAQGVYVRLRLSWQTLFGPIDECVQVQQRDMIGTTVDKFKAKGSKLPWHFTAVPLQAKGLTILQCVLWLSRLELNATLLAVQGQPRWDELLSHLFTICTMEETTYLAGEFLEYLKNHNSHQILCSIVQVSMLRGW